MISGAETDAAAAAAPTSFGALDGALSGEKTSLSSAATTVQAAAKLSRRPSVRRVSLAEETVLDVGRKDFDPHLSSALAVDHLNRHHPPSNPGIPASDEKGGRLR